MIDKIDSDKNFQMFLDINKFYVVPLVDFLIAQATVYLFKSLSEKNRKLQQQEKPLRLNKNDVNTQDLNDLLMIKENMVNVN